MINSPFGQIFIADSKYPGTLSRDSGHAKETAQVIYIDAIGGHGGMADLDLTLCSAIAQRGISVLYATCDETSIRNPYVEVWTPLKEIYGRKPKWIRAINYWRGLLEVLRRARDCHKDAEIVIHIQVFGPMIFDLAFVWLAKRSGITCVATVHDVLPFGYKRNTLGFLRTFYRSLDGLVVHTNFARSEMLQLIGSTTRPLRVIPLGHFNSIHPEDSMPTQDEARRTLGLPTGVPIVLFLGRVRYEKGLEYLIRAMPTIIETSPSAILVIAGKAQPQDQSEFDDLIVRLNLPANVRANWRFVPDSQVSLYFRAADVVALPYVRIYQSAVCFQAYAFSLPVVASSIGGITEQVLDGETGYLVPPADPPALAQALLRVLRDRALATALGEHGHKWAEEHLDWDMIAAQTVQIYQDARTTICLPTL